MHGQEKIIDVRLTGKKPSIVFLNDYPCKTDWCDYDDQATVCTYNAPLHSLDLRFLVGLRVSISATSEQRAKDLFLMAKTAGASFVVATHVQSETSPQNQSGWVQVWSEENPNG